MSTRSLVFAALALFGGLSLVAQAPLPVVNAPSVRTNRIQSFSPAARPPSPMLPPSLFAPPGSPIATVGRPAAGPSRVPAPLDPTRSVIHPTAPPLGQTPPSQPANYLTWDSEMKEYHAKVGESMAHFTFYLTNVSKEVVSVNSVHTSCGCTVAQLPEQPWRLAAGTNGPINVTVNLAGKSGTIVKSVTADTTAGIKS